MLNCNCGGELVTDNTSRLRAAENAKHFAGPKPFHKKKRILKKRMRVWNKKVGMLVAFTMPLVSRTNFICLKCSQRAGFYSAMARNMFQVERLPDGALPIYEKYENS